MQTAELLLGVDAGNTKTIALVARLDGHIAGAARGGCGDIYGALSPEQAVSTIECTVDAALQAADGRREQVLAGGFSLAGADWPEDHLYLERAVGERGLGRRVSVVNDALGALRAGSPDGTGVAVVCGTGIAIGARSSAGEAWHGSFWLEPLGGRFMASAALRAVYRAELGLDGPTTLTARVLEFLHCSSVEEVLHLLTARDRPAVVTDGLAHVLLDEAASGDATARDLVCRQGKSMADYVMVAARRVGLEREPFPLVLAGGVLRHPSRLLAETLIQHVRTVAPAMQPMSSRFEPAVGALLLAFDAAGVPTDEGVLATLAGSLPARVLFETARGCGCPI